jgi:hypothetical protein
MPTHEQRMSGDISDELIYERLVQGALKQIEMEVQLTRIEQLIKAAMIELMEKKKPEKQFVPQS